MKKGSITITAALCTMLIASLLFTLLEVARKKEYEKVLQMQSEAAAESLFAGYNKTLWEEYHLLALDDGGVSEFSVEARCGWLRNLVNQSLSGAGMYLLQASVSDLSIENYRLITDQGGDAFEAAVHSYLKNNIAYESYTQARKHFSKVNQLENSSENLEQRMNDAQSMLTNNLTPAEPDKKGQKPGARAVAMKNIRFPLMGGCVAKRNLNPIDEVETVNAKGILKAALPNETTVSAKRRMAGDSVLNRVLQEGTSQAEFESGLFSSILVDDYLLNYLSCYTQPKSNRALDYELEYVICGKESDEENLKSIVRRLLLVRQTSDFLFLITDETKVLEAETLATLLSVVALNPEAIQVIKYGILSAWAYAEALMDIRTLLCGERVPLQKTKKTWNSALLEIPAIIHGDVKLQDGKEGLSYLDYLAVFLLTLSGKTCSLRSLDVMESTIQQVENNAEFRIDHMILDCDIRILYRYPTVFWGMERITDKFPEVFMVDKKVRYSYLKKAGE